VTTVATTPTAIATFAAALTALATAITATFAATITALTALTTAIAAFAAALTVLQPLEGAAQFVNFAFVAGLLNLRDLQHFEDVFHRLERLLQGTNHLLDIANRLVNRRTWRAL